MRHNLKAIIKKAAAALAASAVCMVMCIAVYLQYFQYVDEMYQRINLNDAYNATTAPLEAGEITTQNFSFEGRVYSVGFVFHMVDFSEEGEVLFTLSEGEEVIHQQSMPFSALAREGYTVFRLPQSLPEGEHDLTATFEARYASPKTANTLAICKTDTKAPGFSALSENSEQAGGSLAIQVIHVTLGSSVIRAFWVFSVLISIVTGGVCFLLLSVDVKKTWVVFLLLVLVGTIYQVVMPPFSAPDEMSHYNTAYRMSNDWLGIENVSGAVVKRACDIEEEFTDYHTDAYTYKYILENFFRPAGEDAVLVESHGEYLGGYRLPRIVPALGITISRLLGFGGILTAYFARFLCLLAFAAMAAGAYHIMPFTKTLVPAIAILPITMHIGGSASYDSTLIGLSLLLMALLLNISFGDGSRKTLKLIALAVICIAIAPLKSAYITLPFLALLIPKSVFSKKSRGYIYKGLVLGLSFLNFARFSLSFVLANIAPAAVERVEAAAATSTAAAPVTFTVPYLLANIDSLIPLVLNTFFNYFPDYLLQLFGGSLGYLNLAEVKLNPLIVFGFMLVVLVASLPKEEDRNSLKPFLRLTMGAVFICTLGMLVAACITWTPIDYSFIWGFQGRYLLPVLPCLMLAIRPGRIIRTGPNDALVLGAVWALHIMAVLNTLTVILSR